DPVRGPVPWRRAWYRAAAAGGRIGPGLRRAWPRPRDPVPGGRVRPRAAHAPAETRRVDEAAAALPRHSDGGERGRGFVAPRSAGRDQRLAGGVSGNAWARPAAVRRGPA